MARKTDVKSIDLNVSNVIFGEKAIIIQWDSNIGWGEYTLVQENEKIVADSECMDRNDDKAFLEELLKKTAEYLKNNVDIIG